MPFTIEHSNGRKDLGYHTVEDAIAQLRREYSHVAALEIESDDERAVARDFDDRADYAYLARVEVSR